MTTHLENDGAVCLTDAPRVVDLKREFRERPKLSDRR